MAPTSSTINDPSLYRTAIRRLKMDYMRLEKEPVEFIHARPDPGNIFEWYFVLEGPPKTPYETGYYLGLLRFPKEYPFKPPSILMLTPNGRFKTNTRLCLSISDFHPESWIPAWHTSTILTGVLSFMTGNDSTMGSLTTSERERRVHAQQSLEWCTKNDKFRDVFPELNAKLRAKLDAAINKAAAASSSSTDLAAKKTLLASNVSCAAGGGNTVNKRDSAFSYWSDQFFLAFWLLLAVCAAALFVHFSSSSPSSSSSSSSSTTTTTNVDAGGSSAGSNTGKHV